MTIERKVGLVQAFSGAVILTLLMLPMGMMGFGQYIWMLFLPLLLFFALKGDFKVIPSMILCYICGVAWAYISGLLQSVFAAFLPQIIVEIVPTIITIFLVLTFHENILANTVFGNVPALFLGMSTTFFTFMMQVDLTPFHLIAFFTYGVFLAVMLMKGGGFVCSLLFGKEQVMAVFAGKAAHN